MALQPTSTPLWRTRWTAYGLIAMATLLPMAGAVPAQAATPVHGVVIDPADYLASEPNAAHLVTKLTTSFAANGINTIYLNTYNVEYGAYYRTTYLYNRESDYGRQDFLGKLIAAAHQRGIRVAAAFYDHQHRGAWEGNPSWRAMTAGGGFYNPPRTDVQYYLSVGHPAVITWWRGFLADLLTNYPNLDGFELREPIINWWGTEADHNPAVTAAFHRAFPSSTVGSDSWRLFRRRTLTTWLKAEIAQIHAAHRFVHVTSVADTSSDGHLVAAAAEAYDTGFDLTAITSGKNRPDAINVELIWQQWARNYNYIVFTPEWTGRALDEFMKQVGGRVPVVTHVELTDFGSHVMTSEEFYRTLVAANRPGNAGINFYSAFLADGKKSWPAVRSVFRAHGPPVRPVSLPHDDRALILYDGHSSTAAASRLQAIQLANLVGHFDVRWELRPVETYVRGELSGFRYVFYQGTVYGNAPSSFLSDVAVFDGTVVWIGQNLFQLKAEGRALSLAQPSQKPTNSFTSVLYGGHRLPAKGDVIVTRPGNAQVLASLVGSNANAPYIMKDGPRFWYVAGSPFSQLEKINGRYLSFADSLNDVFTAPRIAAPHALLRIEGVDPLTDPVALRALADMFAAKKAPFLVGVIPFHVDPATKTRIALHERPNLVSALKYAVSKGGAIVLNGATHQYKGTTGLDAEFWNTATQSGVAEDNEDFVRARLDAALNEVWSTGIHPIAFQTPGYRATAFDYTQFNSYFTTYVERRIYGTLNGRAYEQTFPFEIKRDVYGAHILPENLGVVRTQADIGTAIAGARALLAVRDAIAGGVIPATLSPAILGSLIDRMFLLGYSFIDLYTLPNSVTTAYRVEITGFGWATVTVPTGQFLQERLIARGGKVDRSTATYQPEYARITRSWSDVPRGGIFSMRAVERPQAGDATVGSGPTLPRIAVAGRYVLLITLGLAGLGVFVLFGSYAGVKARGLR